jgi:prevent-host-death family protein
MYNVGMASIPVSEARAKLPELLTRVEGGEEVTITRHGRAVAVLVRPDALRSRSRTAMRDAERIHEIIALAASESMPRGDGLTEERADELVAAIRAARDDG